MKNFAISKTLDVCAVSLLAALFVAASGPQVSAQAPRRLITQEINETQRVMLRGNVHPWARAQFDQGAVADAQPINRIFLLLNRTSEQQAALDKLMAEQVDANSVNYHKWLTPEQYGAQFGPADADVETVKSWLASHGFTGMKTNAGKTIIEFNGTVGTVRAAFSTEIHNFTVRGEKHFANVSDPQIPSALSHIVAGIPSLHNFRKQPHVRRFGTFRRDLITGETRPLFTFTDVNGQFFGMGPADFAKIYNIPSGADGSGQSIAIVARSNINPQDVTDFRTMFGLPAYQTCDLAVAQPQLCVILNGADPGTVSGEEVEADLDSQWSGAVAPKATIKLVVSESEQTDAVDGVDASALFIVDNNISPVLSESFGLCESAAGTAGNAMQNILWQQAAAQGITVSVSSGDNGSAGCDDPNSVNSATLGIAVSGTASTPFNVAVGGTDFDDSGTQSTFWSTTNTSTTAPVPASALGYIPEIPWNDSCATAGLNGCATATASTDLNIVGGSGGPSMVYCTQNSTTCPSPISGKPAFQTGFGDATARDIPDVSLFASDGLNKSFYIICQSSQDIAGDTGCNLTKFVSASPFHDFQAVGGTSASAPAFAGIMALVNQKTGQRQGNANFVLYSLFKAEQALATFASCNSSSFTMPGTQPSFCVFMDVTKGNNAVPCVGGSPNCSKTTTGGNGVLQRNNAPAFAAGTGYDLATGLGSINVSSLLTSWTTLTTKATSTTLSPASINTSVGSSVTLSGSVTSGSGTPTGIVVIQDATTGAQIDTTTLSGTSYSVSTMFLPGGNYTIKAHYGGDGNFGISDSAPVTVTSSKSGSKVIVSFVNAAGNIVTTAQSVQYGSPYILRVDVANGSGTTCENLTTSSVNFICPTGQITLLDNGAPLNDFPNAQTPNATNVANLNNRGFIEDQPIQLPVASHSITATYPGDASYNSGTSNTLSVTITQATTTTAVTAAPASVASGGMVTLTALISTTSNSAVGPTGTVQFSNGSATLGSPVNCVSKGADLTKTPITPASCTATLTTAISFFVPPSSPNDRRIPFEWLAALLALAAAVLFLFTTRLQKPRRAFAYAAIGLFLIASATLAGCSGGSSGGGGGGGGGNARTITAKYSGDTNYATSSGTGSVTIQ